MTDKIKPADNSAKRPLANIDPLTQKVGDAQAKKKAKLSKPFSPHMTKEQHKIL